MREEAVNIPDLIEGVLPPQAHDFLVGNKSAQAQLIKTFEEGRFPQSWLITGAEGIGKASFAWHFARQLVETGTLSSGYQADPDLLERYGRGTHPSIHSLHLPPDDKGGFKNQIPIEMIRGLSGKLSLAMTDGGWRIVIIDPAEKMNRSAANALLKLLEEPPRQTIFFLISHSPNLLLPTIRSRCQFIRLSPLTKDEMRSLWPKLTDAALPEDRVFELAEGSMRVALTMRDEELALYDEMVRLAASRPIKRDAALRLIKQMQGKNRAETLAGGKFLFAMLFGRAARIATGGAATSEAEAKLAGTVVNRLQDWAQLGFEVLAKLDDAARLNLDPEVALFHRWIEIDELLR